MEWLDQVASEVPFGFKYVINTLPITEKAKTLQFCLYMLFIFFLQHLALVLSYSVLRRYHENMET